MTDRKSLQHETRMSTAAWLLEFTTLSVEEVSSACGISQNEACVLADDYRAEVVPVFPHFGTVLQ